MCGIFGYVGNKPAYSIIADGLKSLEYRGYDSYGMALKKKEGDIIVKKRIGEISGDSICEDEQESFDPCTVGIGHTRWATHGEVNISNSHPHHDGNEDIFIVHNGIIENYEELKTQFLLSNFKSTTDSEVIPKLIHFFCKENDLDLVDAIKRTAECLKGNFSFAAISRQDSMMVAVKMGSPLVVGYSGRKDTKDMSFFLSSDVNSILKHTSMVHFMDDGEIVAIKSTGGHYQDIEFYNFIEDKFHKKTFTHIDSKISSSGHEGFNHFMLKEIYEQPSCIESTIKNCTQDILAALSSLPTKNIRRVILTACGTSWHSGIIGSYWFEQLAKIPSKVEYASEFRYKDPIIEKGTLVIAISQSGETADTIAAINEAKMKGAKVLSICNVKESTIDRISDITIVTSAGPEIGVASTKAFTTQLAVLFMLAYHASDKKGAISSTPHSDIYQEFLALPKAMQNILKDVKEIEAVADRYFQQSNALFLGRGVNYPVALEGALKLKEISYIHAEGYPAAEMKHGPIALIDSDMPSIFICVKDESYNKVISNIREVKARHGKVIAIANHDDSKIKKYADDIIHIPQTNEMLNPFLSIIPLQLMAYHIADKRGCEIDKPRNLAKSVTVE